MLRALARVNVAAIERNCARLAWPPRPPRCARSSRPTATATARFPSPAPVEEAARTIARKRHNRLPVVEHGRLVGVVTRVDVLDALTNES